MRKIAIALLMILSLTSCVNQRSVARWVRNHPEKVFMSQKTVIKTKIDTIRVPIKGDTISKFIVSNRVDTFFKEGRAEVRLIFRTDTINKNSRVFIKAICKPDTVTVFDTDTITIVNTTNIGIIQPKWYEKPLNWFFIIIFLAAIFYINHRYAASKH